MRSWRTLIAFVFSSSVLAFNPYLNNASAQSTGNSELPLLSPMETSINSAGGDFVLQWAPGPYAGDYDYVQIEEQDLSRDASGEWSPHFVSAQAASFRVYTSGVREYRLRACRDLETGSSCGEASATIRVEIDSQARTSRSITLKSDLPAGDPVSLDSRDGGASSVRPGQYESNLTKYNAWMIFWANELRRPSIHPSYEDANEMWMLWATYRDFAGPNPPSGEENLQPVWLIAGLRESTTTPQLYVGSLYYYQRQSTGEVIPAIAGSIRVDGSAGLQDPSVSWRMYDETFYQNSVRWVQDTLTWDPDAFGIDAFDNPIDHFSGWWAPPSGSYSNETFGWLSFITGNWESSVLAFFDATGEPIWGTDFWGGYHNDVPPTASTTEFCHFAVEGGWYPDVAFPAGRTPVTHDLCPSTTGWSGKRSYGPVLPVPEDPGEMVLNASVPPAMRPSGGTLVYGTNSSPDAVRKLVGHHDVRYFVADEENAGTCLLVNGQCDLELTWYSDGYYPDAKLYRTLKSGQSWITAVEVSGWLSAGDFVVEEHQHSINAVGEYRFELRRGSASGQLLGLSPSLEVVEPESATPEVPPTPVPNPGFTATDDSTRVGAINGQFDVDESGAAIYSIPIFSAQGSGGVGPSLKLQYNSNNGNGPMGLGWSISGFSAITRCGQTLVRDGNTTGVSLTEADRLCLGGRRLVQVSGSGYWGVGTEYRFESDDLTKVTAMGSGSGAITYFEVRKKDGSVTIYGSPDTTSGARIVVPGSETIFAWPISEFRDSATNFIQYEYFQPNPDSRIEWVPLNVWYTGNLRAGTEPYARIHFSTSSLPLAEQRISFVGGAKSSHTTRIDRVTSFIREQPVDPSSEVVLREYRLSYSIGEQGVSRIDAIEECWSDESGDCLAETSIDWRDGAYSISDPIRQGQVSNVQGFVNAQAADLTGNGRQEAAFLHEESGAAYFGVAYQSNPADSGVSLVRTNSVGAVCSLSASEVAGWAVIDAGASGYQSVIYAADCPNDNLDGIYIHEWLHNSETLSSPRRLSGDPQLPQDIDFEAARLRVADVNGDGLSDLLLTDSQLDSGSDRILYVYVNTTQGTNVSFEGPQPVMNVTDALPPPDLSCTEARYDFQLYDAPLSEVDGSGRVAFIGRASMYQWCGGDISQSQRDAIPDRLPLHDLEELQPNGDAVLHESHATAVFQISPQTIGDSPPGGGSAIAEVWADIAVSKDDEVLPADVNVDGYTDFVIARKENGVLKISVMFNDGTSLFPTGRWSNPKPGVDVGIEVDNPELAPFIRVFDYDGDSRPDLLVPNDYDSGQSARWLVYPGVTDSYWPATFSTTAQLGPRAGKLNEGDQTLFLDLFGAGKTDIISFYRRKSWNNHCGSSGASPFCVYAQEGRVPGKPRYFAAGKVHRVTDGLGAWTSIEYKSLAQRSLYTRATACFSGSDCPSGPAVYETVIPQYIVSVAESLAPQYEVFENVGESGHLESSTYHPMGTARIEYYYYGARMQAGGRGFLGFREVASYDAKSGMLTRTKYRQDFPFIGVAKETHRWYQPGHPWPQSDSEPDVAPCTFGQCPSNAIVPGTLISRSETDWEAVAVDSGLSHIYEASSNDWVYSPSYSSGGQIVGSEFTHRVERLVGSIDQFGNPEFVEVNTYSSDASAATPVGQKTTINEFSDNIQDWHLGRLKCSTVTSERSGKPSITRRSYFKYDPGTGMLAGEIVEPNGCNDTSFYHSITSYQHDLFGNREVVTVSGPRQVLRRRRHDFDSLGRFVDGESVYIDGGFREVSRVISRDRFGNPQRVRNGKGIVSSNYYDEMGRDLYSYSPDGSWSHTWLQAVNGGTAGGLCPQGTSYIRHIEESGGGKKFVCNDVLGRESRHGKLGFSGAWTITETHYDHASRVVEESVPHLLGGQAYWARTTYDELGRTLETREPDGLVKTIEYAPLSEVYFNDAGQTRIVERNVHGEKVSETRVPDGGTSEFDYDSLGRLVWSDGPLPGTQDRIDIQYDEYGNKSLVSDPDKGVWQYDYNALGELVCQMSGNGDGVYNVYDRLGRLTSRSDREGISDVDTCAGTEVGSSSWIYNNVSGDHRFGEVVYEQSWEAADTDAPHSEVARYFYYDSLGRAEEVETTIIDGQGSSQFSRTYSQSATFDQYGRVFQEFDASGDYRGSRYVYNSRGYLRQVRESREGVNGKTYWTILAQDAWGNTTEGLMGNGMEVLSDYDPKSGELISRFDSFGQEVAQAVTLAWDEIGRLQWREDLTSGTLQEELFHYDGQNRLEKVDYRANGGSVWQPVQAMRYDASGNTLCKSDVSPEDCLTLGDVNYEYSGAGGPHAVESAGQRHFEYDVNGNVVRDRKQGLVQREFAYTSYGLLRKVQSGLRATEFHYGPGREMTAKRVLDSVGVESRTHFVGNVEAVWDGASPSQNDAVYRRYVGGVALVTFTVATQGSETLYQHKDHLGSLVALSDESASVVATMSHDAWGVRRNAENLPFRWDQWSYPSSPGWAESMLASTSRGFTGHEQVDGHGIIHMNGRIYDPQLARFLQADSFVEDSGTLNRYTYVHNNPLAYTDPSGHIGLYLHHKMHKKVGRSFMRAIGPEASSAAVSVGCIAANAWYAACVAVGNYEMTRAFGGSQSDAFRNAAIAGATAAAFQGASYGIDQASSLSASQAYSLKVVASGVIGGVSSELGGGSFGHGFASAGISALLSPSIASAPGGKYGQTLVAAIVGGTVSEATGGKFANGAATAAMSYALGSVAQNGGSSDNAGQPDIMSMSDAELDAYMESSGFYDQDRMLAWVGLTVRAKTPPSLPQTVVDLAAGAGDGVWGAITLPARLFVSNPASLGDVRGVLGIDGAVGYDSVSYGSGYVGGAFIGGGALYGGAAFNYVPALGPAGRLIGHPAYGGRTYYSALRSGSLRFGWGRDGGPILRIGVRNRHIDVMRRPNPN